MRRVGKEEEKGMKVFPTLDKTRQRHDGPEPKQQDGVGEIAEPKGGKRR